MELVQPGPNNFLELADTPDTYVGSANKSVVVNSTPSALVFGTGTGGGGSIPELTADPVSPTAEQVWVKRSGGGGVGGGKLRAFLGLGWGYMTTGAGTPYTYQLSYFTVEGTTKRVTLA